MLAVALTSTLLLGGFELWARRQGFTPGDYVNGPDLWAKERRKAKGDALVLIGSSRMFGDVNLDVWEATTGERPIQLAIEGKSPRRILSDLAADESFRGRLVIGVASGLFFFDDSADSEEFIAAAKRRSPAEWSDLQLTLALESGLAQFDNDLRLPWLWSWAPLPPRAQQLPFPDVPKLFEVGPDRAAAMWRGADAAWIEKHKLAWSIYMNGGAPPNAEQIFEGVARQVAADVAAIRARGGEVAFVSFPVTDFVAVNEEKSAPRAKAWDLLLATAKAEGVHYRDHPEMQGFSPPEYSHLSAAEAVVFTLMLIRALPERITRQSADARLAAGAK